MTKLLNTSNRASRASIKRLALASVAAVPLAIGLAAPAQAQIVNTATVTGNPDSGMLTPVQATESVTVALPIVAVNDTATGINGATGDPAALNVLTDDTLNSGAVTTGDVTITLATGSTVPPELTFDPSTGAVGVVAGTAAGTYTFDYTICETANPNNCDTATASVTVVAAPIVADPDLVEDVNGATGATDVLDVLDGDTLNGAPATLATVDISVLTPAVSIGGGPVPVLDPVTGTVDVPAGTPAGTYEIEYQICEELNPTNCSTNTATIVVDPAPIVADPDLVEDVNGATGATDVLDVLDGDTLNGAPATLATVDISVLTPAVSIGGGPVPVLDPVTGTVDVPAGTPAGTYEIEYQICEELNPTNCSTNTATIVVDPTPIVATDDTATGIDGINGDTNALNVFDDDTLNGAAATAAETDLSLAPGETLPAELTFDPATGIVGVVPGTLAGSYSFDYQICEELNPTNCAIATATVEVASAPSLSMTKVADDTEFVTVGQVITYTYTVTNDGNVVIRGVAVGDTHNAAGAAPTPSNETLLTDGGTAGDSTDAGVDGSWDVLAPGDTITFTGTYTVQQADIDNLQ